MNSNRCARRKPRFALGLAALAVFAATGAKADPAKDLQLAGRALGFLENAPSGRVVIGVVFDSSKPASVAQKDAAMAALSAGLSTGAATFSGKAIDVGQLGSASGVVALYGVSGVSASALGAAGKAKHLITISSDKSCAAEGQCVMSVTTSPSVEITVNHNAAAAVGATFKAAFRMMIHEI
jgi:hypothetical protein